MRATLENTFASNTPVKSPIRVTSNTYLFFSSRMVSSFAFVLVVAVVGGGTAYAAEAAVPGDPLYAVKVNVTEPVRAALAFTPEAQADWHTKAVERRLKEAEVLAARGTLTADLKERLEANFEMHTAVVEKVLAIVEERDVVAAADISSRLESSIAAHGAVIARLGRDSKDEESRNESGRLALALEGRTRSPVRTERTMAFDAAASQETGVVGEPETTMALSQKMVPQPAAVALDSDNAVVARLFMNASTTLDSVEARFRTLKEKLDATAQARTEAQIARVRNAINEAQSDVHSGRERVEKALKDATTLQAFLEAQEKFHERVLLPVPDVEEDDDTLREVNDR